MNNRGLLVLVWAAVAFAIFVLGVLVNTRLIHHRSNDQKILIERSHEH